MEQPIPELSTSSRFLSTSSKPQLIPTQLDFSRISRSSGSGSADGGRSWEERIVDLSAELQQICGSPLSPPVFVGSGGAGSPESPFWLTTTAAAVSVSSPPPPSTAPTTSPRPAPPLTVVSVPERRSNRWSTTTMPRLGRCTDAGLGVGQVRSTPILQTGQPASASVGGGWPRPIMVRHEETHETLAKRLSAICGKVKAPEKTAEDHGRSPDLRGDGMTGSGTSRSVVRVKADVGSCRAEDVVVAVRDGRSLTVDVHTEPTATRRLHSADVPSTAVSCLLCHLTSSGSLYILERAHGAGLSVDFTGTDCAYLPVIHCDEERREMTLVLRVPDDFRFEELAVKTVDDSVCITGNGKRATSPQPASCGDQLLSFPVRYGSRLVGFTRRQFRVVVPLPDGCDNRSVVAALSSNNQLVLKARLSSSCRRYTF